MIFQPNLILHVVEPTTDRARFVGSPLPFTTHHVGPTNYPLTTSGNSSIFQAHYCDSNEPFSGPVKHLTFLQLGSCETPNLAPYASTCESVEFNGYIDNVTTVFEVVHQLPNVTKVEFYIGSAEQHCFLSEQMSPFFNQAPISLRVKSLKIIMDLDYFHSFEHDCNGDPSQCRDVGNCPNRVQQSLVCLAESLLKIAGESFPNLKSLVVDLPEDDCLYNGVHSLIKVCPGLRRKTQTSLQNYMPGESSTGSSADIYSIESSGEFESNQQTASWLPTTTSTPVSSQLIPISQYLPVYAIPSTIFTADVLSSEDEMISPCSESYPGFGPSQGISIISHRPPPGFAPLQVSSTQNEVFVQGSFEEIQVVDPEQRVTSWLSSLSVID